MSMADSLKSSNSGFDLADIIKAAKSQGDGTGERPVDKWNPEYCGVMDMVIKADGSWWHEGTRITREPLIKLFASILRKDEDGETYLVTPVEKIGIKVEKAHFTAIRVDAKGEGADRRLYFTTNLGEVVEAGVSRPIRVEIDAETGEPTPFVTVRGRLEALMTRPVFYELVELGKADGDELYVSSGGTRFLIGRL